MKNNKLKKSDSTLHRSSELASCQAVKLPNRQAKKPNGFSYLELILVIGVLIVLAFFGAEYYRNTSVNIQLNSTAENMIFDLRSVRSRSIAGQSGLLWGIHFVSASANPYYELFSTPTDYSDAAMATDTVNYLPQGIVFTSPGSGASSTVLFSKISGTAVSSSVSISVEGMSRTVNISSLGIIY